MQLRRRTDDAAGSDRLTSTKGLVDGDTLAEVLGVSPSTVDKLAREKRIPSFEITPRLRRFDVDEVLRALKEE